jgi:hypothetical protein
MTPTVSAKIQNKTLRARLTWFPPDKLSRFYSVIVTLLLQHGEKTIKTTKVTADAGKPLNLTDLWRRAAPEWAYKAIC